MPDFAHDAGVAALAQQIIDQRFYVYTRLGADSRIIQLCPDYKILAGENALESTWRAQPDTDGPGLYFLCADGTVLARLKPAKHDMLLGQWLQYECMQVSLTPHRPFDASAIDQLAPKYQLWPSGFGKELQLGCGDYPLDGAVNHDLTKHADHVDVTHDLNVLPWPWENNEFTRIVAIDVFEHLRIDIQEWLDECWRILTPGGKLELRVPYYAHENAFTDPTHRRFFTAKTFDYWDKSKPMYIDFGRYYFASSNKWWRVKLVQHDANLLFYLHKDA